MEGKREGGGKQEESSLFNANVPPVFQNISAQEKHNPSVNPTKEGAKVGWKIENFEGFLFNLAGAVPPYYRIPLSRCLALGMIPVVQNKILACMEKDMYGVFDALRWASIID